MDPALPLRLLATPATVLIVAGVQQRFGAAVGGRLVALPLTTAPFLVLVGLTYGSAAAVGAATGVVSGQLSVVAFCAAYALAARCYGVTGTLAVALAASVLAGAGGLLARQAGVPAWGCAAVALAGIGIALARIGDLPEPAASDVPVRRWDGAVRAGVSGAVVAALLAGGRVLGATTAGVLATAPVLLAILTPSTHRQAGTEHARALVCGTLVALPATVIALTVLAEGIAPLGPALASVLAVMSLVAVEAVRAVRSSAAAAPSRPAA